MNFKLMRDMIVFSLQFDEDLSFFVSDCNHFLCCVGAVCYLYPFCEANKDQLTKLTWPYRVPS